MLDPVVIGLLGAVGFPALCWGLNKVPGISHGSVVALAIVGGMVLLAVAGVMQFMPNVALALASYAGRGAVWGMAAALIVFAAFVGVGVYKVAAGTVVLPTTPAAPTPSVRTREWYQRTEIIRSRGLPDSFGKTIALDNVMTLVVVDETPDAIVFAFLLSPMVSDDQITTSSRRYRSGTTTAELLPGAPNGAEARLTGMFRRSEQSLPLSKSGVPKPIFTHPDSGRAFELSLVEVRHGVGDPPSDEYKIQVTELEPQQQPPK